MKTLLRPILIFISLTLFLFCVEVSTITPKKETLDISLSATGVVHFLVSNNAQVSKGALITKVIDKPREQKLALLKVKLSLQKEQIKIEKQTLYTAQDKLNIGVGSKNSYLSQKIVLSQDKASLPILK